VTQLLQINCGDKIFHIRHEILTALII